jgi:hypothetical protein
MSSTTLKAQINSILDPLLFQVIGSTPESIRDTIRNSQLRNNPNVGSLVACTAVFSSAVNKSTLENFLAKPELADVRPAISASFSISNRTNMTGLTLLGHCLLTTAFVGDITFCVEFRKKMGQDHLWAGNLDSGSLSDKQKEILKEKKRVTQETSAKLLGSGFFKFTGIDSTRYTSEEARFWNENYVSGGSTDSGRPSASRRTGGSSSNITPPRRNTPTEDITLSSGAVVSVPRALVNYYLSANNNDRTRLVASIEKRGAQAWTDQYSDAYENDPEGRNFSSGTVMS